MKWLLGWLTRMWVAITLAFVLVELGPGDPARQMVGPQATASEVQRVRHELGWDAPTSVRYQRLLGSYLHRAGAGDHQACAHLGPLHVSLGLSYVRHKPVAAVIQDRLAPTAALAIAALIAEALLGLLLAQLLRANRFARAADTLGAFAASAPAFAIAIALQAWFAAALGWFPIGGYDAGSHIRSLVLPALSVGVLGAMTYAKIANDLWQEAARKDFARTARSKGASKRRTFWVHIARVSWGPLLVMLATDAGLFLGGIATVENVFRFPGLGTLAVHSVLAGDLPTLIGLVMLATTSVSVCSALGRLAAARLQSGH